MVGVTCVEQKQERGIDSTPASEATVEADPLRSRRNQQTEFIAEEALEFGFPGYGPEWRSSLELGRTRAQCPNPTIKRSGLTGIIIEETHDPAGCTRRGVAVYPDPWGRAYINNAHVGVHGRVWRPTWTQPLLCPEDHRKTHAAAGPRCYLPFDGWREMAI